MDDQKLEQQNIEESMWTIFYEYDWLYIVSGQKTLRSESKIFCFVVALGEKCTDMERKKQKTFSQVLLLLLNLI